jgi:hypothetical protein
MSDRGIDIAECQQRIFDCKLPTGPMREYSARIGLYSQAIDGIRFSTGLWTEEARTEALRSYISGAAQNERQLYQYYIGSIPDIRLARYTHWADSDLEKVGKETMIKRFGLAIDAMILMLFRYGDDAKADPEYVTGGYDVDREIMAFWDKVEKRKEKKAKQSE